ncbi:MAG: hypothetical protein IJC87_02855 [Clostridia bacterium]|nr:hypothetical protein [Clostridia bacterium]
MIALWLTIGFVVGGLLGFIISSLFKISKNDCENCLIYKQEEKLTGAKDNNVV